MKACPINAVIIPVQLTRMIKFPIPIDQQIIELGPHMGIKAFQKPQSVSELPYLGHSEKCRGPLVMASCQDYANITQNMGRTYKISCKKCELDLKFGRVSYAPFQTNATFNHSFAEWIFAGAIGRQSQNFEPIFVQISSYENRIFEIPCFETGLKQIFAANRQRPVLLALLPDQNVNRLANLAADYLFGEIWKISKAASDEMKKLRGLNA